MLISCVICFHHNVSGLIYFLYCDFLNFPLSESWLWAMTRRQTDCPWYIHQRLGVLLMAPIVLKFHIHLNSTCWQPPSWRSSPLIWTGDIRGQGIRSHGFEVFHLKILGIIHKESMQLLHMYCLQHNMQGCAAHTLVHAVLRHCHGIGLWSIAIDVSYQLWHRHLFAINKNTLPYALNIKWKITINSSGAETGILHRNPANTIPAPLRRQDISSYAIDYVG